jgi:hypothetical protein
MAAQPHNNESDFKDLHFDDAAWGQAMAADLRLEHPNMVTTHNPWVAHIRRGIYDPEAGEIVSAEEVRMRRYSAAGQAMGLEYCVTLDQHVSLQVDRAFPYLTCDCSARLSPTRFSILATRSRI